ncbi:MAG TPA: NAD(P)-dependent oxidoreductase [Chryseosolibacter sp.]|nr:NAD(P)-dependent oxidoreductase [Chryseosolibacter sp.]
MSEPAGIIGLGRIGLPVARAWLKAGYDVYGYDIEPEVVKEFTSAGGKSKESPQEVARHARVIAILVLDDDQVVEVVTGKEGILRTATPETTIICMSTINRETLEYVSGKCREMNVGLVDCPFTGGVARIPSGNLTLIAAAPLPLIESVRKILAVVGKIVYAGERPGQAQAVKHCNQLLVGATHAATMEVITLARRLGLDPSLVVEVAGSGIAGSDYFRLLSESVLKKTPSPGGLGQMCKDMAIVKNTMRMTGMDGYVASAAAEYFSTARNLGMENRQGADLIEVVERASQDKDETESI